MSSSAGPQAASSPQHPPYAPQYAALGGIPDITPDVPVSAALLLLYLVLGGIHLGLLKKNLRRGHKFVFNGMLFVLCMIRVVTMSLRIAWSCHQRNISLALAANIFVYFGTIVLFLMNWFFVQRIVRAQHTRLGWSKPFRIFHRAAIAGLLLGLLILIIAAVWQAFTLNPEKQHAFHAMQLTGQTYFTVICFAPIILVLISLALPRREVEKFGAGRLRINITILLVSSTILSAGQMFRCVTAWLPRTPLRQAGRNVQAPWYYDKACFYAFNFATELIVIIMYAVVRIDLRFHVPNGSKMAGDYSNRNSLASVHHLRASESSRGAKANLSSLSQFNSSSETIHAYQTSLFDDTRTLADSLQYPASTLTIDLKTGNWKVKRNSLGSSSSHRSSRSSLYPDRTTLVDDIPPVPSLPETWPLPPTSPNRRVSLPAMECANSKSRQRYELQGHALNKVDMTDAISNTLSILEANSEENCRQQGQQGQWQQQQRQQEASISSSSSSVPQNPSRPPSYSSTSTPTPSPKKNPHHNHNHNYNPPSFSHPNPHKQKSRQTFPPRSAYPTPFPVTAPRTPRVYAPSIPHESNVSTSTNANTNAPPTPTPTTETRNDLSSLTPPSSRGASLDIIKLSDHLSSSSPRRILDVSLLPTQESVSESEAASTRCSSVTRKSGKAGAVVAAATTDETMVLHAKREGEYRGEKGASYEGGKAYSPSEYTSRTTSSEAVRDEEAFRKFSFDATRGM